MARVGVAEREAMWRCIGKKQAQRWLGHAIDHHTGTVLVYVFGRRKEEVFLQGKALREPWGRTRFSLAHWDAYTRHLASAVSRPGKRHTQTIERQHLTLRTRLKHLVRKIVSCSETPQLHDIVMGLLVNESAFGRTVSQWPAPL